MRKSVAAVIKGINQNSALEKPTRKCILSILLLSASFCSFLSCLSSGKSMSMAHWVVKQSHCRVIVSLSLEKLPSIARKDVATFYLQMKERDHLIPVNFQLSLLLMMG